MYANEQEAREGARRAIGKLAGLWDINVHQMSDDRWTWRAARGEWLLSPWGHSTCGKTEFHAVWSFEDYTFGGIADTTRNAMSAAMRKMASWMGEAYKALGAATEIALDVWPLEKERGVEIPGPVEIGRLTHPDCPTPIIVWSDPRRGVTAPYFQVREHAPAAVAREMLRKRDEGWCWKGVGLGDGGVEEIADRLETEHKRIRTPGEPHEVREGDLT